MKKVISILLACLMILSLTSAVFADDPVETGSITVNRISVREIKGEEGAPSTYEPTAQYALYRILELESYNMETGAYSYKADPDWQAFLDSADAKAYFTKNDAGYYSWVGGDEDARVAAFAKLALAYAKANDIGTDASTEEKDYVVVEGTLNTTRMTASIIFDDLALGYYLVDSTVGTLCALSTTNPDAYVNAKNGVPTIDKQVQEDSTNQWSNANTADIGQTVSFRTTINVHPGAQNYVLHDQMSKGLTFDKVVKIERVVPNVSATEVPSTSYTVVTGEDLEDDCTFDVVFTQEFCDSLNANDKVIVYYDAILNRNAVIAGDGNPNATYLEYGENNYTEKDTTITKTYGFDLVKTNDQNKLLDGAEFKIYDKVSGAEVPVVILRDSDNQQVFDDDGSVVYRRARETETGVPIVVSGGKVRIVGFDNGTYELEETEAPDGFNKLVTRQSFIIADNNLEAIITDSVVSTGSGVHVVNKTGSMLPETGATGTMLFIVFGVSVVLIAGVLLVTKKRMSMIQD